MAKKSDARSYIKIIAAVLIFAVIGYITDNMIPKRVVLGIFIPLSVIFVCLYFILPRKIKKQISRKANKLPSGFEWILAFLLFVSAIPTINIYFDYTFVGNVSFPFLKFDLAVGMVCGVLFFVFAKRQSKEPFWKFLTASLAIALIASLFTSVYVVNLNYLLDLNPPQERVAIIEEKEKINRRKSPDSYVFHLDDGKNEIALEVGHSDYESFSKGDTYAFKEYDGAFGVPFYISE